MSSDSRPDIDSLLASLRQRVDERRQAGLYPDQLDHQLDAHFDRVISHQSDAPDADLLRRKLGEFQSSLPLTRDKIQTKSRIPGGGLFHRIVGKLVTRQTDGVLRQTQEFAEETVALMTELVEVIEGLAG